MIVNQNQGALYQQIDQLREKLQFEEQRNLNQKQEIEGLKLMMKQNENIQKFELMGKMKSLDPEIDNAEIKRLQEKIKELQIQTQGLRILLNEKVKPDQLVSEDH